MVIFQWEFIAAGTLGGLAHTCYIALSAAEHKRTVNLWLFILSIVTAGILGGLIGSIFNSNKTVAALVGYVGSSIIDNVAASVIPKTVGFK